jgi:hypothetical protein
MPLAALTAHGIGGSALGGARSGRGCSAHRPQAAHLTVLDCDGSSATYGQVVGWAELPTSGNELHHFGWNACSSALCHGGHAGHLERRYLTQRIDLGDEHQMVLELRPAHDPSKTYGFVGVVISVEDLSASVWAWHKDGDRWAVRKVITIPALASTVVSQGRW